MRVIGGTVSGQRLDAPSGRATRPTSDRVREALFSALEAADAVVGTAVLDLYAGSGALGIEALSRGAATATFVESSGPAAKVLGANLRRLGLDGPRARVRTVDVGVFARRVRPGRDGRFGLILADPPYATSLSDVHRVCADLSDREALAGDAVVVIERSVHDPDLGTAPPAAFALERQRTYGDTVLLMLRRKEGNT